MWMYGEEVGTGGIYPTENKGCTNIALITINLSKISEYKMET